MALVLIVFQYAATERSNRALNKIEIEERHRFDLRGSIERRTEKLDQALDDSNW